MMVLFPTPDDPSSAHVVRPGGRYGRHLLDALLELRAEHVHRQRRRPTAATSATQRRQVGAEIGLGQQHDRLGAALARQQQIALEPPRAEVGVERHDDEHDVDVGGDDLLVGDVAGDLAREAAAARQHRDDRAAVLVGTACEATTQSPTAGSSPRLVGVCLRRPASTASISPPST